MGFLLDAANLNKNHRPKKNKLDNFVVLNVYITDDFFYWLMLLPAIYQYL